MHQSCLLWVALLVPIQSGDNLRFMVTHQGKVALSVSGLRRDQFTGLAQAEFVQVLIKEFLQFGDCRLIKESENHKAG